MGSQPRDGDGDGLDVSARRARLGVVARFRTNGKLHDGRRVERVVTLLVFVGGVLGVVGIVREVRRQGIVRRAVRVSIRELRRVRFRNLRLGGSRAVVRGVLDEVRHAASPQPHGELGNGLVVHSDGHELLPRAQQALVLPEAHVPRRAPQGAVGLPHRDEVDGASGLGKRRGHERHGPGADPHRGVTHDPQPGTHARPHPLHRGVRLRPTKRRRDWVPV